MKEDKILLDSKRIEAVFTESVNRGSQKEIDLLTQIEDFALVDNNHLLTGLPYCFFTSLSKRRVKRLFDKLGIYPESMHYTRDGLCLKTFEIIF